MKHMYKIIAALTIIVALWLLPSEQEEDIKTIQFNAFEVTVEGAVLMPKTITLYQSTSWQDILNFVGGYYNVKKDYVPTLNQINQSLTIVVPFEEEVVKESITKININKASFQMLLQIPYMTETRAAELIIYRQSNGPFKSIEELIHVKYIGVQTLENMRPYVSIS